MYLTQKYMDLVDTQAIQMLRSLPNIDRKNNVHQGSLFITDT